MRTLVIAALRIALPVLPMVRMCGDGSSSPVGPPDSQHMPQNCTSSGDKNWNANNLTIVITSPTCGLTIKYAYSQVDYAGKVKSPSTNVSPSTWVIWEVLALDAATRGTRSTVVGSHSASMQTDAQDASVKFAELSGYGFPGNFPSGPTNFQWLDSIAVRVNPVTYVQTQFAWADGAYITPGSTTQIAPSIVAPPQVVAGSALAWRLHTDWDTTAYRYQWRQDGQDVSGATGNQYVVTFPLAGSHTLQGIATRADYTADTATAAVGVAPNVQLSGPAEIYDEGTYTWTASAAGCNSTCTYQWQYQNQGQSVVTVSTTGPSFSRLVSSNTAGIFWVMVRATSAGFTSPQASVQVENLTSGSSCSPGTMC